MPLLNVSLVLFLIMDPLGNLSSHLSLVKELPATRQRWVILRELVIALALMLLFNYLGEHIFKFLDLSETTVRLSSGIILFLIAIKVLFTAKDNPRANLPKDEPFVFPLAVPLIAGPALLATIMLYAHLESYQSIMTPAILLAWFAAVIIFFFSHSIQRLLGTNGLTACERLMAMILVMIAVQRFLEGVLLFWANHAKY